MKQTMLIGGRTLVLNGLKKEIEYMTYNILDRIVKIKSYQREVTGVIGGEQRSCDLYSLFGGNYALRDEEEFIAKRDALIDSLPCHNVTLPVLREKATAIKALFDAHVNICDKRETPEQVAERNRQIADNDRKWKEEAEQKRQAIALFAEDAEPTMIPEGMMGISIGAYYDGSDPMTDYYDRHHSIDRKYLLAIVRKGARREEILRDIISRIPELQSLVWEWHVEEYSMGHGTYLESSKVGEVEVSGSNILHYWYELSFTHEAKFPKSKFFVDSDRMRPQDIPATQSAGGSIGTVSINHSKNGVEIKFPGKPAQSVLDRLHAERFRWSRFGKVWYKSYSDSAYNTACDIAGVAGKTQEQLDSENEANSTAAYVNAQEEAMYERQGQY